MLFSLSGTQNNSATFSHLKKSLLLNFSNLHVFLRENCEAVLLSENWKEKMQEHLFPITPDFVWTGRRELAYLKMMENIAEDIENVAQPGPDEELLIQITC